MAPIPRTTLVARALRARAGTARQSLTRLPTRSYASGHGPVKPTLQSEMPWIAGSLAATLGGVYLLWPEPSAHGHGHDDHAEHKEEKEDDGEEEKSDDNEGDDNAEAKDESKDESKDDSKEESKEDANGDDDDSKEDSKDDEGSDEDKSDEEPKKEAPTKENPDVSDRDDHNRVVKYKDAKGGIKKRLESKNAIPQGDNAAGVHSGQGEHVYNTDTKHSTDQKNNPNMSKKGEGDPDTAKLKKTVDPNRAQK